MMELRILITNQKLGTFSVTHNQLQFREWRDDLVTQPELGFMEGWGEWQDVPEVYEPEANELIADLNDKEHLEWLHGRLKNIHDENENVDYMIRFRKIIDKL